MKAIVQERYGSSDVLELREVDRPEPADHEVLVRIRAAAVNAADWHTMRGDPYIARFVLPTVFGRRGPKRPIRGHDFAGEVEAVGRTVTKFRPGDAVYGDLGEAEGAFAEYVCVDQDVVARKPENLTFEQAAAMPLAGVTAYQGLRGISQGSVLINGASGGVGTFAVQIAKARGAEVTGVCSTRNAELTKQLGADHVVDYTKDDFTHTGKRYDLVLDLVGNRSLSALRRILTPDGTLMLSGGGVFDGGSLFGPMGLMIKGRLLAPLVHQRLRVLEVKQSADTLNALTELAEAGRLTPAIDRTYKLSEVPEAIRYLEIDHARAKVVITV
jgi:NADPH:quinone reductase-like Zn-dependent oxidoreductase